MQSSLDDQTPRGQTDSGADMGSQLPARVGASTMVQSKDLLQGQRTLDIQHNGTVYRLQTTKLGKLILTK